ncbi:MAG: hypothetical protein SFW07_00995, partial [Gammaproteobacteria bacterium]|nr:hypothetical protein [Gammaproteobacteria bacterium]
SNASPASSRKLTEEDNTRIAKWRELRGKNHGNTVSMVQAAMKQGLISNKPLSGGYSLSDAAQADREKIPRRFTQ